MPGPGGRTGDDFHAILAASPGDEATTGGPRQGCNRDACAMSDGRRGAHTRPNGAALEAEAGTGELRIPV